MQQLDNEEKKILALLPKGIDRPRPLRELVKLTGCPILCGSTVTDSASSIALNALYTSSEM